ncbi:MAG: hypothetical protein P9L94_11915 [Candidatus Hinthialibacter antarcticus]|nr:hypothetical protein [Candidatus Hinthialibacter antarcticus]
MKQIIVIIAALCLFATTSFAEFKAGVAVRSVMPDPLLPVSGGIGPSNPATKALGELSVRALVVEDDDVRVAIVSADFLGFPAVLGNRVRKQIKNIKPENILIGVTHTHSAPDCYGFPDEQGNFSTDLKYLDFVCAQMVDAINDAVSNLEPAKVKINTGETVEGIAYNYYAPKLYDPRCHVMQFIADDGQAISTLVNYAIHPEVIGSSQGVISPDLIGPLYDRIQANGGGTGVFMNSAQGGMVTADCRGADGKDIQTWDECIRIGNRLADEALRIAGEAKAVADPGLFCAATAITFPIDSPLLRAIVSASPLGYDMESEKSISTQVNVINLGNAQILTIPGEALPNIGYYLKRKMHGEHNFLFGLTNDAFGYILTKEDYDSFERYAYITRTSLGEKTGEILINESLKFVDQCPKPEK